MTIEQIALVLNWPINDLSRRRVIDKADELGLAPDVLGGFVEASAWTILAALRVEVAAAQAADTRAALRERGLPVDERPRFGPFWGGFLSRWTTDEQGTEPKVWPSWPPGVREMT